jgi:hypothetical protein
MKFNLFSKRKAGVVFEVIRPHTDECLPLGFFWVQAGERKTLGFRCTSFYAYEVRTPVNDGHSIVHLADFLKAHGMKSADELPTVVLTFQKADTTQQNIGRHNIIETDKLDDWDGETHYDGVPNSGVQWR